VALFAIGAVGLVAAESPQDYQGISVTVDEIAMLEITPGTDITLKIVAPVIARFLT